MPRKVQDLTTFLNQKTGTTPEQREAWREKVKSLQDQAAAEVDKDKQAKLKAEAFNLFMAGPAAKF